jgi:hypothetical protein
MSRPTIGRVTALIATVVLTAMLALPAVVAAADMAKVRVLHGVGDAPAVDVYAGRDLIVESLEFGSITDYLSVPAGTYRIRVLPAGTPLKDSSPVIDAKLTFGPDTMTTVAATGSLAELVPQVIQDDPGPTVENAQARVVHLALAPAVDIAPVGGDPVITDLAYPEASTYLDVPPGTYTFEVRAAGSPEAVVTLPPVDLAAGTSSSVFAVGDLEAGTFTPVPALDASIPTTAQVRVLHGSPDAPPVDIVVNGVRVFGNLPFGAASPYLTVPVGSNNIQVIPSGGDLADSPVVLEATLPVDGDSRTTIVASNFLDSIEASVFADNTRVKPKRAQVRVAHLSADAPNVDIAPDGAKARDALLKDVAYGDASEYLTLKADSYDLDVRRPGKKAVIADLDPVEVARGSNYSAYAIGSPADGTFRVVFLVDAEA